MNEEFVSKGAMVLSADEADALREDVALFGDEEVARRVGLSRAGLARSVARFAIHRGSAALVRAYLCRRQIAA